MYHVVGDLQLVRRFGRGATDTFHAYLWESHEPMRPVSRKMAEYETELTKPKGMRKEEARKPASGKARDLAAASQQRVESEENDVASTGVRRLGADRSCENKPLKIPEHGGRRGPAAPRYPREPRARELREQSSATESVAAPGAIMLLRCRAARCGNATKV